MLRDQGLVALLRGGEFTERFAGLRQPEDGSFRGHVDRPLRHHAGVEIGRHLEPLPSADLVGDQQTAALDERVVSEEDLRPDRGSGARVAGGHLAEPAGIAGRQRREARIPRLRLLGSLLRRDDRPGRETDKHEADRSRDRAEMRSNPFDERYRRVGEVVALDLGCVGGLHRRDSPGDGSALSHWRHRVENRVGWPASVKTIMTPPLGRAGESIW